MPKVRFETGQVINFDSTPSQADIDEVASKLGIGQAKEQPTRPGLAENITQHPIRSIFRPVSETLGLPTATEAAEKKAVNVFDGGNTPMNFAKAYFTGLAGDVADVAQTPASYLPVPGGRFLGKIPFNGTTVGQIAKTTPVGKGFMKGVKELGTYEQHLKGLAPTSARAPVGRTQLPIPKPIDEKAIDNKIWTSISQGVRPSVSGKSGQAYQLDRFKDSAITGVKSIVANKDKIQIGDETGKLPESLDDFLEAILQRKKDVWNQRVQLSEGIDEVVDIGKIYEKSLSPLKGSTYVKVNNPGFAKNIDEVIMSAKAQGQIPISEAHTLLTDLNKSLAPFYKNPSLVPDNLKLIEANVAKSLRNEIDDIISSKIGSGYGNLGKEYGALRALEKEILPRIIVKGRQAPKGFFDLADVWSYGDILSGIVSTNPAQITRGLAMAGVKRWIKSKNNADHIIKDMFRKIDVPRLSTPQSSFGRFGKPVLPGREIQPGENITQKPKLIGHTPKYLQERENIPPLIDPRGSAEFSKISLSGTKLPEQKLIGYTPKYLQERENIQALGFPKGSADISQKPIEAKGFMGSEWKRKKMWRSESGSASIGENVYQGEKDITTKVLKKLEGRSTVSKQFISDLTNQPELKQAERDLIRQTLNDFGDDIPVKDFAEKVKVQLLPLKIKDIGKKFGGEALAYENISLPKDIRGPVSNYSERVYESPVKTSAGNVHFSDYSYDKNVRATQNYFAHTRIEDLPSKTRRVIELQSDLFQKGGLITHINAQNAKLSGKKLADDLNSSLHKLRPYENTWHERIIREEIKQASKDGKTKLQFPTGKTAMQIEGLGENIAWRDHGVAGEPFQGHLGDLKPNNLKIGKEVSRIGEGSWIITDVLGNGKFKAVPKDDWDDAMIFAAKDKNSKGHLLEKTLEKVRQSSFEETFDISGKIDTNNPIYRFYEKEVSRYLKRVAPDMQRITDKQGVEWFEINVPKEAKSNPIEAFGIMGPMTAASTALFGSAFVRNAQAGQQQQQIDMDKIYQIESSGNPKAHNVKEDARGLGQIRPPVLKEWNQYNPKLQFKPDDLFKPDVNKMISDWYMNKRIPQMLKYFKKPDNLKNRIIAYNQGINAVVKGLPLAPITKDYLRKYGVQ